MSIKPLPDLDPSKGYLMSMTLENVRCFGSPAQILYMTQLGNPDKPARWTVILGANGVGKTTVLRALCFYDVFDETLGYRPSTTNRLIRFVNLSATVRHIYSNGISDILVIGPEHNLSHHVDTMERGSTKGKSGDLLNYQAAYGAGRVWRGSRDIPDSSIETLFERNAQVRDPSQTLADWTSYELSNPTRKSSIVRYLKEAFVALLPDVEAVELDHDKEKRPFAKFKTKDGWIALDDMSWGYQVFAAFAADYASRLIEWYPNSKTPLAEPGICLVDELDLHMHPKWQREVIDHLSRVFPATQFIVTVHSPLVVQAAEDANLVVLKRNPEDPSRVEIVNDVEAIRGWRIDQVLTSDLFGLESGRTISASNDIEELQSLKLKGKPSKTEKARVAELEEKVRALPSGETAWDIELRQAIRDAAKVIKG